VNQESVDVDLCKIGTTPTLFLPDCATGDNRTLGLHLRALESVQSSRVVGGAAFDMETGQLLYCNG
jgi:hypothetical protein